MKRLSHKYSGTVTNLLIAVAISAIINFSYLLLLVMEGRESAIPADQSEMQAYPREGVLTLTPDGYGYLIYNEGAIDSVYVGGFWVRRLELSDGDRLVAAIAPPAKPGGHYALTDLKRKNGEPFDYRARYNRPALRADFIWQLLFYVLLSFTLLTILTVGVTVRNATIRLYAQRCLWCIAAFVPLYFVAPVYVWRAGRVVMNFMGDRHFDNLVLLRFTFALAVTLLYGRIYSLILQRQHILLENEELKNENLTTRYNMLVGQMEPHFFFNSLNSLAMLVREELNEKALTYIDQLSYTFRYILQNGQTPLATLGDELKFADAYGFLLKIRYADKLFIDIDVADEYRSWTLPALTLQPLIGNAVKHNTITKSRPFHISIRTEEGWLIVSNPCIPKLEPEPSTGIGIENLRNRWQLIAGLSFEIIRTEKEFCVRLPLRKPDSSAPRS